MICAGSRVNSGSMKMRLVGLARRNRPSRPGMSTRGSFGRTISLTCAITMPLANAVASTMAGVSSVLGPV